MNGEPTVGRIIDATLQLIVDHGLGNVSMSDIAKTAVEAHEKAVQRAR